MTHIGDNIKRIRKAAGLSQQDLAERCGISKSQLSRLESGEQQKPAYTNDHPHSHSARSFTG